MFASRAGGLATKAGPPWHASYWPAGAPSPVLNWPWTRNWPPRPRPAPHRHGQMAMARRRPGAYGAPALETAAFGSTPASAGIADAPRPSVAVATPAAGTVSIIHRLLKDVTAPFKLPCLFHSYCGIATTNIFKEIVQ